MAYHYTALVTCLSLVLFITLGGLVGRARGLYKVAAPATTGHPQFERVFRVHYTTMENLVWYLPALWLFAIYVSDRWAAALGLVWIAGRIIYARAYYADPEKRGPGLIIAAVPASVLLLGALIGIALRLAN